MDPILLMVKLGWVPRWMPLLSGTASVYDETGMGASVDAFALGDRQCIKGYWDGCLGGCLCSRGSAVMD